MTISPFVQSLKTHADGLLRASTVQRIHSVFFNTIIHYKEVGDGRRRRSISQKQTRGKRRLLQPFLHKPPTSTVNTSSRAAKVSGVFGSPSQGVEKNHTKEARVLVTRRVQRSAGNRTWTHTKTCFLFIVTRRPKRNSNNIIVQVVVVFVLPVAPAKHPTDHWTDENFQEVLTGATSTTYSPLERTRPKDGHCSKAFWADTKMAIAQPVLRTRR